MAATEINEGRGKSRITPKPFSFSYLRNAGTKKRRAGGGARFPALVMWPDGRHSTCSRTQVWQIGPGQS